MGAANWTKHERLQELEFPWEFPIPGKETTFESLDELLYWTRQAVKSGRTDTAKINHEINSKKKLHWVFNAAAAEKRVEDKQVAKDVERQDYKNRRRKAARRQATIDSLAYSLFRKHGTIAAIQEDAANIAQEVSEALSGVNLEHPKLSEIEAVERAAGRVVSLNTRLRFQAKSLVEKVRKIEEMGIADEVFAAVQEMTP